MKSVGIPFALENLTEMLERLALEFRLQIVVLDVDFAALGLSIAERLVVDTLIVDTLIVERIDVAFVMTVADGLIVVEKLVAVEQSVVVEGFVVVVADVVERLVAT